MDARASLRNVLEGTCEFSRLLATDVVQLDGVTAAIVPDCPERSVVNSVCYEDSERLAAALEEVAAAYDKAGVHAWTVWVPPGDDEGARLLREAGHVLDAAPDAMAMELDEVVRPTGPDDWTSEADAAVLGPLNDRAYGYDGSFERAIAGRALERLTNYVARLDGQPASCCATFERDGDCHVVLVATLPEARGKGLASALMGHALADARERGLKTTSLIATKAGRPLYERLGYRVVGQVQMWERRRPRAMNR